MAPPDSGFVRGAERCLFTFHDTAGDVQGFFSIAFLPQDSGRCRLLLGCSRYFYFRAAYRGHPRTMTAPWRLLPMSWGRYGLRSLHFVTTAFPQSDVSLARSSGRVWSLREPETPGWKRQGLLAFATASCGEPFDPERGLVTGSNLPDSESLARSDEARRLGETHEALNPTWRQGHSLPILFSVDGLLVSTNLRRIARRVLRR